MVFFFFFLWLNAICPTSNPSHTLSLSPYICDRNATKQDPYKWGRTLKEQKKARKAQKNPFSEWNRSHYSKKRRSIWIKLEKKNKKYKSKIKRSILLRKNNNTHQLREKQQQYILIFQKFIYFNHCPEPNRGPNLYCPISGSNCSLN